MSIRKLNHPVAGKTGLLGLVILFLAGTALPVGAVPQIMSAYGDQMPWHGAEINGMGGTGVALYRGGLSNIFNPAFLTEAEAVRIDAGFSLNQEHEDRFVPLFDGFGNTVTQAAIASNRHHNWQGSLALARRVQTKWLPIHVGVSLTDRYPYHYNFQEEIRNPDFDITIRDGILEERKLETTGTLRALSFGVGFELCPRVAAGAAVHYAFGTRTSVRSVADYDGDDNSYRHEDELDLEGLNFTVGLKAAVTPRLELGASWESQLKAEGTLTQYRYDMDPTDGSFTAATTVLEDSYYRYPNIFRGGMTFRPRTDPRTVFTMEFEYLPWDEMADSQIPGYDNPQNLDGTMDVRIGLQHTFYNGMPLRFGFRHVNSPIGRFSGEDASISAFSAGTGFVFGKGTLSACVELSKVNSYVAHVFDYDLDTFGDAYLHPVYGVLSDNARVEDTRFRVGVGYSLEF